MVSGSLAARRLPAAIFNAATLALLAGISAAAAPEKTRQTRALPLTHTVWEARQMRLWPAKTRVVTQMGNQMHSRVQFRLATRLMHEGVIGKVKEVRSWHSEAGNSQVRLQSFRDGARLGGLSRGWFR